MLEQEKRFYMMREYLDELYHIQGLAPLSEKAVLGLYAEARLWDCSHWIDVCNEAGQEVGFLIIGEKENCHPGAKWFIQEAYIKPEHRRKGYMSFAVKNYVCEHPGVYCMFILTKNQYANNYWHKLFEKLGYKPHDLLDIGAADEHCRQYGFAPKGEEECP